MQRRDLIVGFTLIEILAVCAVVGILLATAVPAINAQLQHSLDVSERAKMRELAKALSDTFESTDLESTNVAAIGGSIPTGVDPTAFSASTNVVAFPSTTNVNDWFAKVARGIGAFPEQGIAPTFQQQPLVAAVLSNQLKNLRILLVGPENESSAQRFLLISLMAQPGLLSLPALPNPTNLQDPNDLALFNDTWNTEWSYPGASLPNTWLSILTSQQVQAWQGSQATGSRLSRLIVQRIVCAKHTITINNTHSTDTCYVYYNFNGATAANSAVVGPNTGTAVIPGILSGRQIQVFRGTSPPPAAQLMSQFILRNDCEITLQD